MKQIDVDDEDDDDDDDDGIEQIDRFYFLLEHFTISFNGSHLQFLQLDQFQAVYPHT